MEENSALPVISNNLKFNCIYNSAYASYISDPGHAEQGSGFTHNIYDNRDILHVDRASNTDNSFVINEKPHALHDDFEEICVNLKDLEQEEEHRKIGLAEILSNFLNSVYTAGGQLTTKP